MADIYNPDLQCGYDECGHPPPILWMGKIFNPVMPQRLPGCGRKIWEGETFTKVNHVFLCARCTGKLSDIGKERLSA